MGKTSRVRNFFKQFDIFAAPATLRANEEAETSSFSAGLVSLIMIAVFVYVFIDRTIGIVSYSSIDSKQTIGRLSDDELEPSNILFAVGLRYFYMDPLFLKLSV